MSRIMKRKLDLMLKEGKSQREAGRQAFREWLARRFGNQQKATSSSPPDSASDKSAANSDYPS